MRRARGLCARGLSRLGCAKGRDLHARDGPRWRRVTCQNTLQPCSRAEGVRRASGYRVGSAQAKGGEESAILADTRPRNRGFGGGFVGDPVGDLVGVCGAERADVRKRTGGRPDQDTAQEKTGPRWTRLFVQAAIF